MKAGFILAHMGREAFDTYFNARMRRLVLLDMFALISVIKAKSSGTPDGHAAMKKPTVAD